MKLRVYQVTTAICSATQFRTYPAPVYRSINEKITPIEWIDIYEARGG